MKRFIAMLLATVMVLSLAACGSSSSSASTSSAKKDHSMSMKKEDNQAYSTDTAKKDYSGRTLNLLLSVGGGGDYYTPIAKRMMELYPGLTVNVTFDKNAADIMRTKVLAGEAPDIYDINVNSLPWYDAIEQKIAAPIDEMFELPTMDGSKKLGDIIDQSGYVLGEYKGQHYVVHEYQYLAGFWYDAAYFRENNLTIPTDWASMQKLGEEAKALGVNLMGYCGTAANEYAIMYWFWPMLGSLHPELVTKLTNLDYEAWKSPEMQDLVEKIKWVKDNDLFEKATVSGKCSEDQMQFINHEFLLWPCGSWLEAEMADAWTPGWELTFLPYTWANEANNVHMIATGNACQVSPTTQNWDLVCEFFRLMFSDDKTVGDMCDVHKNVVLVDGFSEKFGDKVDPSVAATAALMKDVNMQVDVCGTWYPSINDELGNMLNSYFMNEINEEEFVQRGYDFFKKVKEDPSITKFEYKG